MSTGSNKKTIKLGMLEIDTRKRGATINYEPLALTQNERGVLAYLAQNQGKAPPRHYILAQLRTRSGDFELERVIVSLREKIALKMPEAEISKKLIEETPDGSFRLISAKEFEKGLENVGQKKVDLGWFSISVKANGDGSMGYLAPHMDGTDVALLTYMRDHAGVYHLPADIARDCFKGTISGIAVGKRLAAITGKLKKFNPALGACLHYKMHNRFNYVMFVPHGMTAAQVDKELLASDIKKQDLGWFTLEVSTRFNPKRTRPAARVAGTNVILNPAEMGALLHAYDNHGHWIVGRMLKQADLPDNIKAGEFISHMQGAFKKLQDAKVKPEDFIQFHGGQKPYVRVLRKGETYPLESATPVRVPRSVPRDVTERINAGGWLLLEIRKNGTSVIIESGQPLNKTITTLFKYVVENPQTILTPMASERIFKKRIAVEWFYESLHGLQNALSRDGCENAFYSVHNQGTVFLPRQILMRHGHNLRDYFNGLKAAAGRGAAVPAYEPIYGPLLLHHKLS